MQGVQECKYKGGGAVRKEQGSFFGSSGHEKGVYKALELRVIGKGQRVQQPFADCF